MNQVPSPLLTRLIDDNPDSEHDTQFSPLIPVDALQQDIKQNLEAILNTRVNVFQLPDNQTELSQSILAYGLPDFSTLTIAGQQHQEELCQTIENVITQFEPRLQKVSVTELEQDNDSTRTLRLQIRAEINLKPNPKPTMFETNLDIVTHTIDVEEELS